MRPEQPSSYLSPKLEGRGLPDKRGRGVFAIEKVIPGELLVVWGGIVITGEQLARLSSKLQKLSIQVEEDLYMVPSREGPADWVNHCCNPNAGLNGQVALVAMQVILPGQEVCYDFAMSDGSPYDEFECQCDAPNCRGLITENDWQEPDLWARYTGYFSPYLQRRIDRLKRDRDTCAIL
jgi:hypothetical protein